MVKEEWIDWEDYRTRIARIDDQRFKDKVREDNRRVQERLHLGLK